MKVLHCAVVALSLLLVNCELASSTTSAANDQGSSSSSKLIRQEPAPTLAVTAIPQCMLIKCSDQGAGVCASDGKTYPNACQVTVASCNNPGLKVVSEGPCPTPSTPAVAPAPAPKKCSNVCPFIYQPVCDSKGVVYSNSCEFSQAQCKNPALKKGKCSALSSPSPAKKCELPQCAPIEKPICVSNGKTYMNRCLLSYSACKDPTLTVMYDGECGSVVQDQGDNTPTGCMAMMCRQFSECRVDERTGLGYCADVCAPERCAKNEECVLNQVQCFTTPCPAIAEASASTTQAVDCAKRSVCTNKDGKVCSSDGQTYANKCKFEAVYCASPGEQLTAVSDGACKKSQKANANAATDEKAGAVTPAPTNTTVVYVPAQAAEDAKSVATTPATTTMQTPSEAAAEVVDNEPVTPTPTTFKLPPTADTAQEEEEVMVVEDPAAAEEPAETEVVATAEQVEELSSSDSASGEEAHEEPAEQARSSVAVSASSASASSASSANASGSGSPGGVDASYAACQVKCPTDWIPVCGNDGETYANECLRILAKCRDPSLTTAHTGACVKDPAPTDATTSTTSASVSTITTSLEVTASGAVKTKCNHICPKAYEPVCGSDSVTYANQCLLDYAACRTGRVLKVADGKCAKRKRGKTCVPEICTGVEDALCGSDGTTYLNACMFENAQCLTPLLTILHDGECDGDTQLKCSTLTCPKFTECREDDAIDVAYCADVCAAERCGENEECQLLDAECFTASCSPVATCVPLETSSETEIY